mgnify:CR=1 FL=1
MRIDPLDAADCPEIGEVMRENYAAAFGLSMSAAALDGIMARLTADRIAAAMQDARFLGVRSAGTLAGFVQWNPPSPALRAQAGLPPDATAAELSRLYVRPALLGGGIGSALLDAALARIAASPVLLDVWERNDGAIRLYRSRGFAVIADQRPVFADGPAADRDLIMLRPGGA